MNWPEIIAAFINTVLVLLIIQALKFYIPKLKLKVPWLIPILSGAIGYVIMPLQTWLIGLLGVPIDLSPIIGVFTGGLATTIHQIKSQAEKGTS